MAINLNGSTPAAPAGSTNVTWQSDVSGNVSAYVGSSATQLTSSNVDLTAQTANIATATLFTPSVAGIYRVTAYIIVTTPDGASSTLPSITIGWTDKDNATAQTFVLTPTNAGNTKTTFQQATMVVDSSAAANITYATASYASGTPATMQYAIHLRIEQM